jgi:prepilin-type N-terminal cleavage/methylation domain-containing protein
VIAHHRHFRNGWTLIEVLIVIGIIALLTTIGTFAFTQLTTSNKQRATLTTLANARALLKEYLASAGDSAVPGGTMPAPGNVSPAAQGARDNAVDTARNAIYGRMWRIPGMRKSLEQVPSNQKIAGANPNEAPVLTDAWNNPIVFVPAGGMSGVSTQGGTITVTAPDARPFFASAGPDEDFSKGDDNIYSFQAP